MSREIIILLLTAASLGFLHTLTGPDHYIPFISLARARNWSINKTAWITGICGLAHVGSSILIGLIGIHFTTKISQIIRFESTRGSIAAWMIMSFGLVYLIWGIRHSIREKQKQTIQSGLENKTLESNRKNNSINTIVPWILFIIFLFGPCEPLIPVLMYPSSQVSISGMMLVVATFSFMTISTMMVLVLVPLFGLKKTFFKGLEPHMHIVAGVFMLICGIGIQFLGL